MYISLDTSCHNAYTQSGLVHIHVYALSEAETEGETESISEKALLQRDLNLWIVKQENVFFLKIFVFEVSFSTKWFTVSVII